MNGIDDGRTVQPGETATRDEARGFEPDSTGLDEARRVFDEALRAADATITTLRGIVLDLRTVNAELRMPALPADVDQDEARRLAGEILRAHASCCDTSTDGARLAALIVGQR